MSDGIPKIPSRRNQDPAHVMNLPSLNMGYEPCSKKDITIVDLDIQVYGLDEIQGSTKPVVAIVSPLCRCSQESISETSRRAAPSLSGRRPDASEYASKRPFCWERCFWWKVMTSGAPSETDGARHRTRRVVTLADLSSSRTAGRTTRPRWPTCRTA